MGKKKNEENIIICKKDKLAWVSRTIIVYGWTVVYARFIKRIYRREGGGCGIQFFHGTISFAADVVHVDTVHSYRKFSK